MTTLPARSVMNSDYDNCEGDDSLENNEKKSTNHVKKKTTVSSPWLSGEKRINYSPPRKRPLTRGGGERTYKANTVREPGGSCGSIPGSRLNSESV